MILNNELLTLVFLIEARDDQTVTEETREGIKDGKQYTHLDSLTYNQVVHMDRHDDIIKLAYRNKF